MIWPFNRDSQETKNRKTRRLASHRGTRAHSRRLHRLEQLEPRHLLAVLTVNTHFDDTLMDSELTLREALAVVSHGTTAGVIPGLGRELTADELTQINLTTPLGTNDTIRFDSVHFDTPRTMDLTAQLEIDKSLTIIGPGFDNLTIDAQGAFRVFSIDAGDVSIRGLALTNGDVGADNGGAVYSTTLGTLTIADSRITGSSAATGGGIFVSGNLVLNNVEIGGTAVGAGNEATIGDGGGVFSPFGGSVTLKNSVVSGNVAAGDGGGIRAAGIVNLHTTRVEGNSAVLGGGIYATNISMQHSTIVGNDASSNGGGINAVTAVVQSSTISGNTAAANGGGIYGLSTVVVRNSTVYNNTSTFGGGGGIAGGIVTLQNATVTQNDATALEGGGIYAFTRMNVQNSIIVGNSAGGGSFPDVNDVGAANTNVRFSLIGDIGAVAHSSGAGQQFEVLGTTKNDRGNFIGDGAAMAITLDDAFGPGGGVLADNGGVTQTVALLAGSIAINAGSNALAVNSSQGDQRGLPFARISPLGGVVDMGAFEAQTPTAPNEPPTLVNPIPNQTATVGIPFVLNAAVFFADADGDPLTFTAMRVNGGLVLPPGALPDWLSFDSATGMFVGTPTALDLGAIEIQVTATDNKSVPPPPLPSSTFTLTVLAAPTTVDPPVTTLPFTETFDTVVPPALPPAIQVKVPSFQTVHSPTVVNPLNNILQATRPTVGARPVATVDLAPAAAAAVENVKVDVSADPGNGTTLWSNAVVVFDFESPTNYKFAGVFQIINRLIIGEVRNGVVRYNKIAAFPVNANQLVTLNVTIDRATSTVTLAANGTSVVHTYASIGAGTVGVGTINANAKFDNLIVS